MGTFIKISVIIPVYNMEDYLDECLRSVTSQTLKEIEILCVNDGSTDSSGEILRKWAAKDSRILLLEQENTGVSSARNRALREARGMYVSFMDPDDYYPENDILETLWEKAEENHVLICGGSFSEINEGALRTDYEGDFAGYVFEKEGWIDYKDYQFDYGYHRFIYDRTFLISHDCFFPPYKRCQDPPFFVKAMTLAGHFYALPKITYRYRCGFQTPVKEWPKEKFLDMLQGYQDNLDFSREHHLSRLHLLTIRRLEDPYVLFPSMEKMLDRDFETLAKFSEINTAIDVSLVKEANPSFRHHYFIIKELRDITWHYQHALQLLREEEGKRKQLETDLVNLRGAFDAMRHSVSFRTGRALTWAPRKIRDTLK